MSVKKLTPSYDFYPTPLNLQGGGVKKICLLCAQFYPPPWSRFYSPLLSSVGLTQRLQVAERMQLVIFGLTPVNVQTFSRAIFLANVLKSECSENMVLPMLFCFSDSIKLINTFIKPVLGLKIRWIYIPFAMEDCQGYTSHIINLFAYIRMQYDTASFLFINKLKLESIS